MSNNDGQAKVLNWRGPLLAAGIFAAVFAILLLMAQENQSNTSDMGSSLREDPYGTSLIFDSYANAGYEVKRSRDADSLADQDATRTTAFLIGGRFADLRFEDNKFSIGQKALARLEDFLARGGRVVLVAPSGQLKSQSQGWEVATEWKEAGKPSGPSWIGPDPRTMLPGSEKIYLASDAPWLKTDAGWSALYAAPEDGEKPGSGHVYMAKRAVGKGELIAASQEAFLLNEAVKNSPNPVLLDFLAGGRRVLYVDETLHGLQQNQGVLWLVQRYRLQAALLLFWATLLVLLWSMSGDLVRRPAAVATAQIVRYSEGADVAARRLLQRSIPGQQVLAECWEHFRRRSPQDAEAIASEDSTRLRAALNQPPVSGYNELRRLVVEHRASAKTRVQVATSGRFPSSMQDQSRGETN